jgi:hypothetical protein
VALLVVPLFVGQMNRCSNLAKKCKRFAVSWRHEGTVFGNRDALRGCGMKSAMESQIESAASKLNRHLKIEGETAQFIFQRLDCALWPMFLCYFNLFIYFIIE